MMYAYFYKTEHGSSSSIQLQYALKSSVIVWWIQYNKFNLYSTFQDLLINKIMVFICLEILNMFWISQLLLWFAFIFESPSLYKGCLKLHFICASHDMNQHQCYTCTGTLKKHSLSTGQKHSGFNNFKLSKVHIIYVLLKLSIIISLRCWRKVRIDWEFFSLVHNRNIYQKEWIN